MNFDLPLILVLLTFLTGIIWLIDYFFLSKPRKVSGRKEPWWVDYSRSFFPVFLIVLIIRSFIFQAYRVPTGSLEPTVIPGDFLLVGQYAYGLRLPVIGTKVLDVGEPKRGDIAVFKYPPDPKVTYVKRIVGVPGDHIVYKNRMLTINGKLAPQKAVSNEYYDTHQASDHPFPAQVREEDLLGVKHHILWNRNKSEDSSVYDFTVPQGYYFAMGDNRDDSGDSRFWGLVPEKDLIGKAYRIIFSWDGRKYRPRFSRIGTKV